MRAGDQLTFTPSLDLGSDSFTYRVEDSRGGSLFVTAQITPATGLTGIHFNASDVSFSLSATAGTWDIERSEALPDSWIKIGQLTILGGRRGAAGSVEFHDTAPSAARAFYRAVTISTGGGGER